MESIDDKKKERKFHTRLNIRYKRTETVMAHFLFKYKTVCIIYIVQLFRRKYLYVTEKKNNQGDTYE
jgi:hypothetical protein